MSRESQSQLILKHLEAGNSLTVLEALNEPFRCYALSSGGSLDAKGN